MLTILAGVATWEREIVPRRANAPIDRPHAQQPIRCRTQQRHVVVSGFTEPRWPVLLLEDHRHAVVQLRHLGVRHRGHDDEAAGKSAAAPTPSANDGLEAG